MTKKEQETYDTVASQIFVLASTIDAMVILKPKSDFFNCVKTPAQVSEIFTTLIDEYVEENQLPNDDMPTRYED